MDFQAEGIVKFFRSRKLAIFLIVIIILLSIAGTHIPQKQQLKSDVYETWKKNHPVQAEIFEKMGFTNLFSSYIFLGMLSLLFINTLFCTKNMVSSALRKIRGSGQFRNAAYITGLENSANLKVEDDQNIVLQIAGILRSHGYGALQEGNRVLAHKNNIGSIGTPLFHISILFILMAAIYGSTGRIEGDMRLVEGQTLSEEHGNYMFINEGIFFNEDHRKFDITLEKFYGDYTDETGTPRGGAGKLVITENGQKLKTGVVYSNNLMSYGGYTFLGNVYGLAPLLILRNPDGTVYSGSYVTASDTDGSGRYVASFELGDTGLEGALMVYMTSNLTSGNIMKASAEQTPILFLRVFDRGTEVFDGTLRLNDTLKIDDMYLGFYDIKYWSNFYVVKDDGTLPVYAGIGLLTLSLMISYFIIPKKIWVEVVKDGDSAEAEIFIGGRADKFGSLYEDEFNDMISKLKERLHGTD